MTLVALEFLESLLILVY